MSLPRTATPASTWIGAKSSSSMNGAARIARLAPPFGKRRRPPSAISLGSLANAHDGDFVRRGRKDDPVVPNSKPEVSLPLPGQSFYVTIAGISVLSERMEDSEQP